ncbi:MAG TPA: NAD(P)H-hydrate dehydratase [Candidatus Omnitrophota bacterium]|nr:NAD(P)H-hydrate dehydratase [Candidatus Omnitrophota bacterium]
MRLPAPLLRLKKNVYKNHFGHVLILAGSRRMLGAAALSGLAAMRSGAGLVTVGVPQSLNTALQRKLSPVIMTFPLPETPEQTLSPQAWETLSGELMRFDAIAIGPGLSTQTGTRDFILKAISAIPTPLVIDADALNALSGRLDILRKSPAPKILTPHPGEMARLLNISKTDIEKDRKAAAIALSKTTQTVVLLKGARTVIAAPDKKCTLNSTGNAGMATAGSGDVLTGMIAAFLGQGLNAFEAARWGAYLHGLAGDLAAKKKTRLAMIASDLIDFIPPAVRSLS